MHFEINFCIYTSALLVDKDEINKYLENNHGISYGVHDSNENEMEEENIQALEDIRGHADDNDESRSDESEEDQEQQLLQI